VIQKEHLCIGRPAARGLGLDGDEDANDLAHMVWADDHRHDSYRISRAGAQAIDYALLSPVARAVARDADVVPPERGHP
jgi:hypothetical protein